jgi:hypothetical protein
MATAPGGRHSREAWRLALRLSGTAFVGGVLFALVGAFAAAAITFSCGVACAVIAAALRWRGK